MNEARRTPSNAETLSGLRRRWWLLALTWLGALLVVAPLWPIDRLQRAAWLIPTTTVSAYQLWLLRGALPANHRPGESRLLPTLGPGNRLTLARGFALALLGGFLFIPRPSGPLAWVPALLYTAASVADYVDGYLARRAQHATLLGERLDIAFDSLGVLIICLLAVAYGQLPPWYLPLGLGRYLFLAAISWRRRRAQPVYALPPSAHRRVFAGFHMGFLTVVLWPIIPPAGATIAAAVFGGATAASFIRDWGVVSGRLDPSGTRYRRRQERANRLLRQHLPPFLRLLLLIAILHLLTSPAAALPPAWSETLHAWHLPFAGTLAYALAGLALVGAGTSALGIVPRLAAFLLLFPVGVEIISAGLRWSSALALVASLLLLLLGGGRFALWQPEEEFIFRRAGES